MSLRLSQLILVIVACVCFSAQCLTTQAAAYDLRPTQDQQANNERPTSAEGIAGTWSGMLNVGALQLQLVFNIEEEGEGKYTATMDSPDQGAKGIPVDSVTLEGREFALKIPGLTVEVSGTLSEDGSKLDCTFKQAGMSFPLVLERKAAEERARPQMPQPPFEYEVREVEYDNPHAEGVKLAGTLTIPSGEGPFPAVVMVSGSGAQDRDETIFGHKPFWVIADDLAKRGVAVLRFDDRGVGGSTGNPATATTEDFATDALAGVEFLATQDKIDANHIGVMGHSEGGLIAPMVANQSEQVAFIILLAGPGVTGEEILITQTRDIILSMDPDADTADSIETLRGYLRIIREGDDPAEIRKQASAFAREMIEKEDDETLKESLNLGEELPEELDTREEWVDELVKQSAASLERLMSPWMDFFIPYDPRGALTQVKQPVLAVIGSKDTQVNPKVNLPEIEEALQAGGNADFVVKELPGLNHLFQTSETGAPNEYGQIEETFSPDALKLIGDWILEHCQ